MNDNIRVPGSNVSMSSEVMVLVDSDDDVSLVAPEVCDQTGKARAEADGDLDASLALALQLQQEEESAIAMQNHRGDEDYARRLEVQEEEGAKRRRVQEEAASDAPDMVAAHVCEEVRQLAENAEREGGSCINYDCARLFFRRHKALLDASKRKQTSIQIVYHGTLQNGQVFRSIMDGNLKVPDGRKIVARGAAYGTGIYTTLDPEAATLYSKGGPIFMCLVLPGSTYFCNDSEHMRDQPRKQGFDSHASPCQQVLVLFESDQVLPVLLVDRTHIATAHHEMLQILSAIRRMTGNTNTTVEYRKELGDGITQQSFLQKLYDVPAGSGGWGWRPKPE
eukprot:TRINITY_DN47151_c0_g1_i1.p1 TRINITY_DN47151_c0_g1~~TRINITY_DN47151_c0_g1_i1.p1  ORF type:complete len:336 (-),score=49.09 TRINITY_DN47151_c0_g1_i1:191-1198(-)